MSHTDKIRYKGKIVDLGGGEVHSFEFPEKCYGAVLKCGHCGKDNTVPILMPFRANNPEEVKLAANLIPRGKRDNKDYILSMGEISECEYRLIDTINDYDLYLTGTEDGCQYKNTDHLKIFRPADIDKFNRMMKDTIQNYPNERIEFVKTSDMYPDSLVLQKTFAPYIRKFDKVLVNENREQVLVNVPVYELPQKVKLDDFLDRYLYYQTYRLGIKRKIIKIVSMYYQIYGKDNPLGIIYKDGKISFIDHHNIIKEYEISKDMRYYLEDEDIVRRQENRHDIYDLVEEISEDEYKQSKPSAVDKFERKIKKTKEHQERKGSQPGDD